MASAQVVETSVTNNSPSQDSNHPDDLFQSRYVTPGFKPFFYVRPKVTYYGFEACHHKLFCYSLFKNVFFYLHLLTNSTITSLTFFFYSLCFNLVKSLLKKWKWFFRLQCRIFVRSDEASGIITILSVVRALKSFHTCLGLCTRMPLAR